MRHTFGLHHIITVYNDMFDHVDCITPTLAKKKTPWKEDLYSTVKLAREKLPKLYAQSAPTMGKLLI